MKLEELEIEQIRSVAFFKDSFSPKTNILLGPNGAGKTTLLESIHLLSLARSFRKGDISNLVHQKKDFLRVSGSVLSKKGKTTIQFGYSKNKKRIMINGKRVKKTKEIIGVFPTVVFSPDMYDVVSGGKRERHDFFNRIFCMADPRFTLDLLDFLKILKYRRILIKNGDIEQLNVWKKPYMEICRKIWVKRHKLFDSFSEDFIKVWNDVFPEKNANIICTRKKIPDEEKVEKEITEIQTEEISQKRVLFGPQKDDYKFISEHRDIRVFGSQGERKFYHYILRLTEAEFIRKISGKTPVLLLDDIFAKMDELRIEKIVNPIINKFQMFITSTDIHRKGIDRFLSKDSKIIQIS